MRIERSTSQRRHSTTQFHDLEFDSISLSSNLSTTYSSNPQTHSLQTRPSKSGATRTTSKCRETTSKCCEKRQKELNRRPRMSHGGATEHTATQVQRVHHGTRCTDDKSKRLSSLASGRQLASASQARGVVHSQATR